MDSLRALAGRAGLGLGHLVHRHLPDARGHCGIRCRQVGAGNLPVQYRLSERFVVGVKQGAGLRFALGAESELFAGRGVLVTINSGTPEQDEAMFHDLVMNHAPVRLTSIS